MKFASAFLSHQSKDKPLVEVVARELGRRGVVSWLDRNDLEPGLSLHEALKSAISRQVVLIVFLSANSISSPWVEDKLSIAFDEYEAKGKTDSIIPVFVGDANELVSSCDYLRSRWLHMDGKRVDLLGIPVDPGESVEKNALQIASDASRRIYKILEMKQRRDVVVRIDQRGHGRRTGEPDMIAPNWKNSDFPALVFRPDAGKRTVGETLVGNDWTAVRRDMEDSLSEALGNIMSPPRKDIYIRANAQLGFAFALGRYFSRNTSTNLFCENSDGRVFNNKDYPRDKPLEGGNPRCESIKWHKVVKQIPKSLKTNAISLILSPSYLADKICFDLESKKDVPPVVWVKNDTFTGNDQVRNYIADIIALLLRLGAENGTRTIYLYSGLPFNVLTLLSSSFHHVVDKVVFMEYRRDLQDGDYSADDMYAPLE